MKGNSRKIGVLLCVLLITVVFVVFEIFGIPIIKKYQEYQKAEQLFLDGKYEEAKTIYWSLGEFCNAQEQKKACDYGMAEEAMKKKDYESAKMIYEELGEYAASKDKVKQCDYQIAESYRKEESYEEAAKIYKALGKYKKAEQRLLDCKDGMAANYFDQCDYQKAYELYTELAEVNYKGAKKNKQKALQEAAHDAYNKTFDELEEQSALDEISACYSFYDINGDAVDELILELSKGEAGAVGIYEYKNGQVEEIGRLETSVPYLFYGKEQKIFGADLGAGGRLDYYQYQNNSITKIGTLILNEYRDMKYNEDMKKNGPKGKFGEWDLVYAYTEPKKDTVYYTEQEFKTLFQKKFKVDYDKFWENVEEIEWVSLSVDE